MRERCERGLTFVSGVLSHESSGKGISKDEGPARDAFDSGGAAPDTPKDGGLAEDGSSFGGAADGGVSPANAGHAGTGGEPGIGGSAAAAGAAAACIPPERDCAGECIAEEECCRDDDCPSGMSCVSHACVCSEGTKPCDDACIPESACCTDADCTSPPAAVCVDCATLRTYSEGSCGTEHVCSYAQTDKNCSVGCEEGACLSLYPTQVAVGALHVCALMNSGRVYCWGRHRFLGDGSDDPENSPTPVLVTDVTNAIQITVGGGSTTCALLTDHTAKCWGDRGDGATGVGPASNPALVPETVPGLTNASEIKTDGFTTCALLTNGTVRCWGRNGDAAGSSYPHAMTTSAIM